SLLNAMVEAELIKDPSVQKLKQERDKLIATMRNAALVAVDGEKSAYVQRIKTKVTQKDQEMESVSKELRPRITQEIRDKSRAASQRNLARLGSQYVLLKNLEDQLQKDLGAYKTEANDTKRAVLNVEDLRDELANWEELAKKVSVQVENLSTEIEAPS